MNDAERVSQQLRTTTLDLLESLQTTPAVQKEATLLHQHMMKEQQSDNELNALAQISSEVARLAKQALEIEHASYTRSMNNIELGLQGQKEDIIHCKEQTVQQTTTLETTSQVFELQLDKLSILVGEQSDDTVLQNFSPALTQLSSQFHDLSDTMMSGLLSLQSSFERLEEKLKGAETEAAKFRQRAEHFSRLSRTDPLTQLANRNGFEEFVRQEFQRWRRYGTPLTVAVVDLDHFKSINDQFGHLVGDQVLRAVAMQLTKSLRESDLVARFGGEEFVVLLTHTELEPAYLVMDRLRKSIASLPFRYKDQKFSVTISIGLSQACGEFEFETIFEQADQAMYQAKREGRNRCRRNLGSVSA